MKFIATYPALLISLVLPVVYGEDMTSDAAEVYVDFSYPAVTTDQNSRDLQCGSVASYHPNYSLPWDQGTCEFVVTCNSPSYNTELDCCKGSYGGQISMACINHLENPPTSQPTKLGGPDIYYPDYTLAWPDGKCINTTPVPNGWPTYTTMLACCKGSYGGQISMACIKALPNPPTSIPTKENPTDWYPDYSLAWPDGKCINRLPVPSGRSIYQTQLGCCHAAYLGQMSKACIIAATPSTSNPSATPAPSHAPFIAKSFIAPTSAVPSHTPTSSPLTEPPTNIPTLPPTTLDPTTFAPTSAVPSHAPTSLPSTKPSTLNPPLLLLPDSVFPTGILLCPPSTLISVHPVL